MRDRSKEIRSTIKSVGRRKTQYHTSNLFYFQRLPLTSAHPEVVMPIDTQCAGCPHPVPLNDPSVLAVAEFAVIEYDRRSDEDELHTLVRLIRAHSQVYN